MGTEKAEKTSMDSIHHNQTSTWRRWARICALVLPWMMVWPFDAHGGTLTIPNQNPKVLDLSSSQGRFLITGDVHAEYEILMQALRFLGYEKGVDHVILAGDLVARGSHLKEDPERVERAMKNLFEFAFDTQNVHAGNGNHDQEVSNIIEGLKYDGNKTKHVADSLMLDGWIEINGRRAKLANLPDMILTPFGVVVHAGIDASESIKNQKTQTLLTIETSQDGKLWFEGYRGSQTIIASHEAFESPYPKDNVINVDGAVYREEGSLRVYDSKYNGVWEFRRKGKMRFFPRFHPENSEAKVIAYEWTQKEGEVIGERNPGEFGKKIHVRRVRPHAVVNFLKKMGLEIGRRCKTPI